MPSNRVLPNKTAEFYYKLSVIVFFCGMPNVWIEDLHISKRLTRIYRSFSRSMVHLVNVFLLFEIGAFFTNQNLNQKQKLDLLLYGISHPMMWAFTMIMSYQTAKVQKILSHIMQMKNVFNDEKVEKRMIKKSMLYSTGFISSCMLSMAMYTFEGFLQVIVKGTTFTTAWPDVENNSITANLARVVWNISWWILVIRGMGMYAIIICLTTSMSHQFIDLQEYFYKLNNIFEEENLQQREAEFKYKEAFRIGIDLFKSTTQCLDQSKLICGSVLSGQILFNIVVLVITMSQLVNLEGNPMGAVAVALTSSGVLIGTGLFMCNAGDITVEASHLATAMYSSGWQHCHGRNSGGVKNMVKFSMMAAQRPIVIFGFGIMELSYQSYVTLLKTSYSVFSLLCLD